MNILGIAAFYHDSAACLVRDGIVVAAAEEERFSRIKGDASFPRRAIAYCLGTEGLSIQHVDAVAYYELPRLRYDRVLERFLENAPRGGATFRRVLPLWRSRWDIERLIRERTGYRGPLHFYEHHRSHAASAFFPSPFPSAAVLTLDGTGEWATAMRGRGSGSSLQLVEQMDYPHSLGLLYSAFTHFLGFKVNSAEYKVMGLAPYGEPRYVDLILRELLELSADGSFGLNLRYFDFDIGLRMTNARFERLFGMPRRRGADLITDAHADVARSLQDVTNEIVLRMARDLRKLTGERALCLAGGVGLNCVANGLLARTRVFDEVWVQPAAGDAGGAVGAALQAWFDTPGARRAPDGVHDQMGGAFLGPGYDDVRIRRQLERYGLRFEKFEPHVLAARVAELLSKGAIVGWHQGRTEFGPRALGHRSILADPRDARMQAKLNRRVKERESFRPFAPSVLGEAASRYFDIDFPSPYMLFTVPVASAHRLPVSSSIRGLKRMNAAYSDIPAVTHVDCSARVQTVTQVENQLFYRLLRDFADQTGCPVLVNTSLNVRGEPLCSSPEDSIRCFMGTQIDALAIGPYLAHKGDQTTATRELDWALPFPED